MIQLLSNRFHLVMTIGWIIIFVILWQADWYRTLDGNVLPCDKRLSCPWGTYCKHYKAAANQCRPYMDGLFRD